MYISLRNTEDFPQEDFDTLSNFILTDEFTKQVKSDCVNKDDEATRLVISVTDHLLLIRHTEFAMVNPDDPIPEIYLSSVKRYGFIDLYQIGTDANKNSILYWAIVPKSEFVVATFFGIICSNNLDTLKPKRLARFDKLWIAGSKNSTVLAIDLGSSHLVT